MTDRESGGTSYSDRFRPRFDRTADGIPRVSSFPLGVALQLNDQLLREKYASVCLVECALIPRLQSISAATSVLMREAKLNFDRNGDPLGVAIVLSGEELEELGVDLDSDTVAYWIEEGELQFEGRSR